MFYIVLEHIVLGASIFWIWIGKIGWSQTDATSTHHPIIIEKSSHNHPIIIVKFGLVPWSVHKYRSHARCNVCSTWENIATQRWMKDEGAAENKVARRNVLSCTSAWAVNKSLGRESFSGPDLKHHNNKLKLKKTYTLVCLTLKEREQGILQSIDKLKAQPCRFL